VDAADRQRRWMQDRSQHDQGEITGRDPKTLQHPERVRNFLSVLLVKADDSFSSEEEEQIRKENEWAEEYVQLPLLCVGNPVADKNSR